MEYVRYADFGPSLLHVKCSLETVDQLGPHRVGDSGLYVSKIILGTSGYGSPRWQEWVLEEEAALPLLKHAFDRGINTWDTVNPDIPPHLCHIIGMLLTLIALVES